MYTINFYFCIFFAYVIITNFLEMSLIESGKYVIVRKQKGDHLRLAKVNERSTVGIEKLRVNLKNAIGKPFGLFEVKNGQIGASLSLIDGGAEHLKTLEDFRSAVTATTITTPTTTTTPASTPSANTRKRPLEDEPETDDAPLTKISAQMVTMEEVLSMKSSGASTSVIVSFFKDEMKFYYSFLGFNFGTRKYKFFGTN
jgi:hypothetical protein